MFELRDRSYGSGRRSLLLCGGSTPLFELSLRSCLPRKFTHAHQTNDAAASRGGDEIAEQVDSRRLPMLEIRDWQQTPATLTPTKIPNNLSRQGWLSQPRVFPQPNSSLL